MEVRLNYEPAHQPPSQNCQPRDLLKPPCFYLVITGDPDGDPKNNFYSCCNGKIKYNIAVSHCHHFVPEKEK